MRSAGSAPTVAAMSPAMYVLTLCAALAVLFGAFILPARYLDSRRAAAEIEGLRERMRSDR